MTCLECEEAIESNNDNLAGYIRVGESNVKVIGCDQHIQQLVRLYEIGRMNWSRIERMMYEQNMGGTDE